jgi:transcriptional regulator with XRE-family HTH domain
VSRRENPQPCIPLIKAVEERNMSAAALGRRVGVSSGTVRHWLHGRTVPQYDTAVKVAELLDIPLAKLWPSLTGQANASHMAAVAGVATDTATRWLSGQRRPGPDSAARLAAAGLPVREWPSQAVPKGARLLTTQEVLNLPSSEPDPRWRERAACANGQHDPDFWWPVTESDPAIKARLVCSRCPVLVHCRDAFLADLWPDRTCIVAGVKGSTLVVRARQRRQAQRKGQKAA